MSWRIATFCNRDFEIVLLTTSLFIEDRLTMLLSSLRVLVASTCQSVDNGNAAHDDAMVSLFSHVNHDILNAPHLINVTEPLYDRKQPNFYVFQTPSIIQNMICYYYKEIKHGMDLDDPCGEYCSSTPPNRCFDQRSFLNAFTRITCRSSSICPEDAC